MVIFVEKLFEYTNNQFTKMDSKKLIQVNTTVTQLSIIIDNLQNSQSSLIDVDLSLEKTRLLYEQLTDLKLEKLSKKESEIITESIGFEKEDVEDEELSTLIDQEALKYIEEKESIDSEKEIELPSEEAITIETEGSTENDIKDSFELIEETKPITEVETRKETLEKEATIDVQNKQNTSTIADKFEEKTSLNDILANIQNDENFATQLQNSPIKDLKSAISLNDKIWFTRELFDGNNDIYISTLDKLNKATSLEDAISIAEHFNWNKKESSTKRFLELIYRRFI